MIRYQLDFPPHVAEVVRHLEPQLKQRIKAVLRALASDPARGDALKGDLSEFRKYRVGRFRVVYALDSRRRVIRVVAIGHRRRIYEEVAALVASSRR
jgi:mRNA interferase RelE/StbE